MTVTTAPVEAAPTTSIRSQFVARGLHWPLFIVTLLLIPVVAGGYLAFQATHDPTFAIEADYYRKAVAWDATMAQEQANATLGWQATVTAAPVGASLDIAVALQDKAGANLPGLKVHVEGFFLARSLEVPSADAQLAGDGRYHAILSLPHGGVHEVRVRAERGAAVFTTTRRLDITR